MFISPKKYILTNSGEVKEAGPGVSGSLIVAEGGQIKEDKAAQYGLLPGMELAKSRSVAEPTLTQGIDSKSNRGRLRGVSGGSEEPKPETPPWSAGGVQALPLDTSSDSVKEQVEKAFPPIGSAGQK